jgi:hypothetical protein
MSSPGMNAYRMAYQISPIFLTDGIAQFSGGILPIVAITEALNFTIGLLGGAEEIDLDNFFAHFEVMPGGSLLSTRYATYPLGSQQVAGNAAITQPKQFSMRMMCPARGPGGYAAKTATMIALQATLDAHIQAGGTFTVATPSYIYTNCLLLDLIDAGRAGDSKQVQEVFIWQFFQPLITIAAVAAAQNSLMGKIGSGLPVGSTPGTSGLAASGGPPTLQTAMFSPNVVTGAVGAVSAGVRAVNTRN